MSGWVRQSISSTAGICSQKPVRTVANQTPGKFDKILRIHRKRAWMKGARISSGDIEEGSGKENVLMQILVIY